MSAKFNALLVEGIPGAGKSTLIDHLIRRHVATAEPRKVRSFVHLAQTHTYGPLAVPEDEGTLTVGANLAHLARIAALVEWLRAGVAHPRHPPCFVLIDTLHLTHCVRPGVVTWDDVADVDRRLADAGCKLLVLRCGSNEVLRERLLEARAESEFLRYARKFASNEAKLVAHFRHEDERFADMLARSAMPALSLRSDRALAELVDAAYEFWRRPT